jgi:hypothetical protein
VNEDLTIHSCHIARRPSPLEVEAAEMAANVDYFSYKKQSGLTPDFHSFGTERISINTAKSDFCGSIALGC